jgi:hypothetical protein
LHARKNTNKTATMTLTPGDGYFILNLPFHNEATVRIRKK